MEVLDKNLDKLHMKYEKYKKDIAQNGVRNGEHNFTFTFIIAIQ